MSAILVPIFACLLIKPSFSKLKQIVYGVMSFTIVCGLKCQPKHLSMNFIIGGNSHLGFDMCSNFTTSFLNELKDLLITHLK
ncbi:Uncharacterised protein [Wolbachia endosymbiont wPip_Mol of Culex molestus]|nr:Uncharacterised protein [Wolbachia endosymbiont wPip_Mol of Culex molestus]